jgi:tyrosyl-tRNA synthetase
MSKSLGNYVGIAESPNEMFGKLMSIPDNLMPQYYELCTDVPMDEVKTILEGVASGKIHPMSAKKRLAREIVAIYHSEEEAAGAQAEFERVFSSHELPSDIPAISVSESDLQDGKIWIAKLLTLAGFAASSSEARRLVTQGGVTIDGDKIVDHTACVTPKNGQVLRVGKLKFGKIEIK